MSQLDERRASVRMPFISKGICYIDETKQQFSGTLRDISITGMFMKMKNCPPVGQKCRVEMILKGKHSRLMIEDVGGTVTRNDAEGVAIRFDELLEWFVLIPLYYHKMRDLSQFM